MTKNNTIFFVTTIDIRPLKEFHKKYIDYQISLGKRIDSIMIVSHNLLFTITYKEAEHIVLSNMYDLSEDGTNKYIVIEGFKPDFIHSPTYQVFFEFFEENDIGYYKKLNEFPKVLRDYVDENCLVKYFTKIG